MFVKKKPRKRKERGRGTGQLRCQKENEKLLSFQDPDTSCCNNFDYYHLSFISKMRNNTISRKFYNDMYGTMSYVLLKTD